MSVGALRCDDLRVTFGKDEILRGVSLEFVPGTWTAIVGPNGAGKTTLLRAMLGLASYSGQVVVGDDDLSDLTLNNRARRLSYVPQQPTIPLGVRVLDYVLLGRIAHQGFGLAASNEDCDTVQDILVELDLVELASRRVDSLSGGERQRTVVARALAQQSPLMLLDEPTTSLDIGHQYEVLELIDGLRRSQELSVISTMHDLSLAGQFADRIVLLNAGQVVADGSPIEVLSEELLHEVYGVSVKVITDERGIVVVPHRSN